MTSPTGHSNAEKAVAEGISNLKSHAPAMGRWARRQVLYCPPDVYALAHGRNPFGVGCHVRWLPRVARSSQPWAEGHNPFGIETLARVREAFTLIELILVMALLAIAASIVTPALGSFFRCRTL